METQTLSQSALAQGIYRLGQISADPPACNSVLLQRMVEVAASVLGVDFAVLAVFEHGIERPASAVQVAGPWPIEAGQRIAEVTRWDIRDRPVAQKLATLERNCLYRRSELIDDKQFRATRLFTEVMSPMRLTGDHAVALFRRTDGCELMINLQSIDERRVLSEDALRRAQTLCAVLAQCWAATWRTEPAWMKSLKPQSRRVLDDVLCGYDDDQIAQRTNLTYHSVRAHLKRLFRDANVRSRLHLMQQLKADRKGGVIEVHAVVQTAVLATTKPAGVIGVTPAARRIGLSVAG